MRPPACRPSNRSPLLRPLRDFRFLVLDRIRVSDWQRTLVLAALVGVLGALATIGFREGLHIVEQLAYGRSDSLVRIAAGLPWWVRLITPAIGGVFAGLLLTWARRIPSRGAGGDYMEAIALGDGRLPVRVSLLRALSSAATVTSGGAIGREGSMVQLAALAGSLVGRWRRLPVPRLRLMVACGAAAGVATAYNAPIAGALFIAEIVLHSVAIESLGPLLVSAVAANVVVTELIGFAPVYQAPAFTLPRGSAIVVLAILGVLSGLLAPLYLALLDRAHVLFRRWKVPLWLKLAAGGLAVGALSNVNPGVWGNGYSVVNSILQGQWLWDALLLMLVLKLLAVSATTGSGAVGGIFTPTLFVGSVAGGLFSVAVQHLWPGAIPASAGVAIGMGAFLAACTHAPLMSVLMIFEMTENYSVIVPLMLACVIGYYVSSALRRESIYSASAGTPTRPAALTMAGDFLRTDTAVLPQGSTLSELKDAFLRHRWPHVYVLDAERRFLGAVSLHDVTVLIGSGADAAAGWPASLLRVDYPRVSGTTPAWQVLEIFATHPGERLPVVDDGGRLLGHVTKTDLVLMFKERLSMQ